MLKLGLRFEKRDAKSLTHLVDRIKADELPLGGIDLYEKAAAAAAIGEPLVVHCERPEEVAAMADAFALYLQSRPNVEQLSQ